jgi:hypothetical protein
MRYWPKRYTGAIRITVMNKCFNVKGLFKPKEETDNLTELQSSILEFAESFIDNIVSHVNRKQFTVLLDRTYRLKCNDAIVSIKRIGFDTIIIRSISIERHFIEIKMSVAHPYEYPHDMVKRRSLGVRTGFEFVEDCNELLSNFDSSAIAITKFDDIRKKVELIDDYFKEFEKQPQKLRSKNMSIAGEFYKEFDLEECINKYDNMAIIVFDSNQTEEGSVIATDSKVNPDYPVIFLSSDKSEIYHTSKNGRQIISNSKRRVFGKLALPLKKKTLYWNLYRDSGKYHLNDSYSFDNAESAKEKAKEEVEKYKGLEFIKTISIEVEE